MTCIHTEHLDAYMNKVVDIRLVLAFKPSSLDDDQQGVPAVWQLRSPLCSTSLCDCTR